MGSNVILDCVRQISAFMDNHCRKFTGRGDLTPAQCFCIVYIYENDTGDFISADLCSILGTSRASVSLLLKGLKKKGYLQMSSVKDDDRKKSLTLTQKGLDFAEFMRKDSQEIQNVMFEGLSPEDITVTANSLKIMLANLKKYRKGGMCCDKNSDGTGQTV